MNFSAIGESIIAPDLLEPNEPILDICPSESIFTRELIRRNHFVFVVEPDPMATRFSFTGMSWIKRGVVAPQRAGTLIYACQHGESKAIEGSRIDTYSSCHIEYVKAFEIRGFCEEIGVEQWGIIRVGKDAEGILAEWPGAIAKQITISETISDSTMRHVQQWYEPVQRGLFVMRGLL